jgi:hypothetical protein
MVTPAYEQINDDFGTTKFNCGDAPPNENKMSYPT